MSSHDSKKRKRNVVLHQDPADTGPNTTKPSAIFKPTQGRTHTLSIALPGSIIANAQTHDLQTYLASTIARAAAVFSVTEIVIFHDGTTGPPPPPSSPPSHKHTGFSDPSHFLASVLSYLETPPHLRRALMPFHQNFRFVGNAPSLDMPHHMRAGEWCRYREGVALDTSSTTTTTKRRKGENKGAGTMVECGLPAPVEVSVAIPPNTRVTLKFARDTTPADPSNPGAAEAVSPDAPAEEGGYYWGYTVRQAHSLSAVFTEAPWENGYDVSIGTSERGVPVEEVLPVSHHDSKKVDGEGEKRLPKFKHLLLVFGGVAGLEVAANADAELGESGITGRNVRELFDAWVNLVPGQGSRTIRCEEAVWIGLAGIRGYVAGWGL